jgi:hypothetical protein
LTVVNGLLGKAFPTKRFDHLTSSERALLFSGNTSPQTAILQNGASKKDPGAG